MQKLSTLIREVPWTALDSDVHTLRDNVTHTHVTHEHTSNILITIAHSLKAALQPLILFH